MAISELVKETIVGILYGIFLWATRVSSSSPSSSMGSPKGSHDGDDDSSGLSIALKPEGENASQGRKKILHSYTAKKSTLSSSFFAWLPSETSSSWTSSTRGDLIGTESGVHVTSGENAEPWENPKPSTCRQSSRAKKEEKQWDIPPPITLLRGQGDYTGPLPWFLTREHIDGRLILREVTVQHFEYLEATRADGRLRMNLVAADNTANCCHTNEEDRGENIDEDNQEQIPSENGNEKSSKNDEDEEKSLLVLDDMDQNGMPISFAASLPNTTIENEMKNFEKLRKCLTYAEGLASRNFLDQCQPSSPLLF